MSEVRAKIDIAAAPERVYDLMLDPNHLHEWVTIHRTLTRPAAGQPRLGYEMDQTLCMRGVNFHVRWELEDCEEPRHAIWKGRGPARSHAETEYRLTAVDGGTRFAYRNEFKAPLGPLGAVASRAIVGGLPEREAHQSLRNLKSLVEKG